MQKLVKRFLYLVYILIVGGLLAAIILTFHQGQANAPAKTSKSIQTATAQTPAPKKTSNKSISTKKTSPAATSSPKSKTSSSPASSSPPALTNTGPGDTIGLFAGASLIAGMLHRRRLIRQSID